MKQLLLRMHVLRLCAALVVAVLIYNLFHIQIIQGGHWRNTAENNRFRHLVQVAPRGKIITADGVELASNLPGYSVSLAFDGNRASRDKTVETLARLLELTEEDIEAMNTRISDYRRSFEPLELFRNVDFNKILLLEENRHLMPSLVIQVTPRRVYPQDYLLGHALGRTIDYTGREGLELSWNEHLTGTNGFSVVQVRAGGRPVGLPIISQVAVPGNNIILTIDSDLQHFTHEALLRGLAIARGTRMGAKAWSGSAVVMDPNTGRILALISEPSVNANAKYTPPNWEEEVPYAVRGSNLFFRPVQYPRTVGSIFKMLVGLAALEEGKVTPTERIFCGGPTWIVGRRGIDSPTICWEGTAHGHLDMREAIRLSCNVYFGTLAHRLGYNTLREYFDLFGIGPSPFNAGFDCLPLGEQGSANFASERRPIFGGDVVQMGYGQINEFTALQMANYIAMLANGGIHYKPYMVDRVESAEGEIVEQILPTILNSHQFSAVNLRTVQEGMLRMGQSNANTRNLTVSVAGKTGTAEQTGEGFPHGLWVGYAPFDNPEIVVVVILEHGGEGFMASRVAAEIINYYFTRGGGTR
jgi:penicillin-binding protein 2